MSRSLRSHRKPVALAVACNTEARAILHFSPRAAMPQLLQEYSHHVRREETAPECGRGTTYHRPGLADGHQTSEEVFIVQLAEHMGVVGYHNGDFFHHLASWPFHSSSCHPAPDQAVRGQILLQLSASAHTHLSSRGWSVKEPESIREGKERPLLQACLATHPQQKAKEFAYLWRKYIHCKHLLHS